MMSRRSTSLSDLARRGFSELSNAATLLEELAALTGLPVDELVDGAAGAADPDRALTGFIRVARRDVVPVREVLSSPSAAENAWRVLGVSSGLGDFYLRHPHELTDLALVPDALPTADELRAELLASVGSIDGFAADGSESAWLALRVRYRRMVARIAAFDVAAADPVVVVDAVAAALADAAAAALEASLSVARAKLTGIGGPAMFSHAEMQATRLAIIGMGKAGARELNYVSDVDVIFVSGTANEELVSEARAIDIATRLAVHLMRGISGMEMEPPLWEVDANLRPEGKQGALVRSLESHLTYYDRWAKSWEFQALLKARALAGDAELGAAYVAGVQPKIWTSSARENFVDSVQRMRERVTDNIPAEDIDHQIKLGPGGLRDIEFTVQLLQLVHGLSDEKIRERSTLGAIDALAAEGYIGRDDAAAFAQHYRQLRVIEHRLQLENLRRTHLMPRTEEGQRFIARASKLAVTGGELIAVWEAIKREVREIHVRLFYRPLLSAVASLGEDERSLSSAHAHDRLAAIGFRDPASALRHIQALTTGLSRKVTIQRHLMPIMIRWFSEGADPDYGLVAFRRISERLGDSPWFLGMLRDSSVAAQHLTRVLSGSRYVGELMEWIPESVAWLDQADGLEPRAGFVLQEEARAIQSRHETTKDAMKSVRALRRRELLRTAMASMLDVITLEQTAAALTTITEVTIQASLRAVRREVVPPEDNDLDFSVIAMGRFGGAELTFGSDADVMFIYDANGVEPQRAHELSQQLVAKLREHSEDHRVPLELDADLRPEGRSGPMVRSYEAYEEYYERWSQPWEAQALLRARGIAGSVKLIRKFTVLADGMRYPEKPDLAATREIKRIKARVEAERLPQGVDRSRHLKLGPGSISDVEWLVQLLQFQHAWHVPDLRTTSTVRAMAAAVAADLISESSSTRLMQAWELSARLRSAITLLTGRASDVLPGDRQQLDGIGRVVGYPDRSATRVEEDYLGATRRSRRVFEKLFYG